MDNSPNTNLNTTQEQPDKPWAGYNSNISSQENTRSLEITLQRLHSENQKLKYQLNEVSAERDRANQYLDVAMAIVVAVDLSGSVTLVNKRACEVTGFSQEELMGKNWIKITGQADADRINTHFINAMKGRREFRKTGASKIITKEGQERSILWNNALLVDENGIPQGVFCSGEDQTDKQKLEDQLRQSEKMKAIGQLAGGIAHDFNNQLTSIIGYAELLNSRLTHHSDLKNYVTDILAAASHSSNLTSQLLAFARKGKYLSVPVDIHSLIDEIISVLTFSIDKNISLIKEFKAENTIVQGDPTQLQNSLLNLAINARDAMTKGGKLTFKTETLFIDDQIAKRYSLDVPHGSYIKISVCDNGCGMAREVKKRIFEPFFTTKNLGKGTGMGLPSVYGTIESHKGAIVVNSKVNHGSTFELFLPLAKELSIRKSSTQADSLPVKGKATILFVDDEIIICELAKEFLDKLGYAVTVANSGKEAISIYKENWNNIDLIVIDMIMPGLSGRETIKLLKKVNPNALVLLSSGYSLDGDIESLYQNSIEGFIQKPYHMNEVSETILETLKKVQ